MDRTRERLYRLPGEHGGICNWIFLPRTNRCRLTICALGLRLIPLKSADIFIRTMPRLLLSGKSAGERHDSTLTIPIWILRIGSACSMSVIRGFRRSYRTWLPETIVWLG